jgi:hypothetical protein
LDDRRLGHGGCGHDGFKLKALVRFFCRRRGVGRASSRYAVVSVSAVVAATVAVDSKTIVVAVAEMAAVVDGRNGSGQVQSQFNPVAGATQGR